MYIELAAGIILIFCARRSDDQPVERRRRQRQKKNSYKERVKRVGDLWNDATALCVHIIVD